MRRQFALMRLARNHQIKEPERSVSVAGACQMQIMTALAMNATRTYALMLSTLTASTRSVSPTAEMTAKPFATILKFHLSVVTNAEMLVPKRMELG
jgi:hypothetical protein